ncbi:MAG TPA: hypothetical protein VGK29_14255 [Paludibaculum sp.]
MSILTAAHCLHAQAPAAAPPAAPPVKEAHDLPARATPVDYQAQAIVGPITIAAEFTGHGMPCPQGVLISEEFVAVEVAFFGKPDARFTINAADFSLRINGKKTSLPSQPYGLAGKEVKDPEWNPPEAAEKKSKGSLGGSGNAQDGAPPPSTPKVPIELRRNWQQRIQRAAIAEGDRPLPQAGLLFFQHRGKTENIRSIELIYTGAAGEATLSLR